MMLFIKKLLVIVKALIINVMLILIVPFVFAVTFILLVTVTDNYIPQEQICEAVLENQDDLEMIADDLRSYDMARVYVSKENITTYINMIRLPDGRYMLGDNGPDFSASEELQRFMKKMKIQSIQFTLYDELQIVTFKFYDGWTKGAYWVDPDTPTEKAYTSDPHDLTPSGDGWEFVAHGDRYYTEKICDNWYFFELTDQPKAEDQKIAFDPA